MLKGKVGDKAKIVKLCEYGEKTDEGRILGAIVKIEKLHNEDPEDEHYTVRTLEGYSWWYTDDEVEIIQERSEDSISKPILEERKKDKIRMELVDQGFPLALLELAKVMTWANENKGYKDHDWRNIPNAENAFKGAAARHRVKFDAQRSFGNEMLDCTDEESGIIHLAHEAFNVLALLELALVGKVK